MTLLDVSSHRRHGNPERPTVKKNDTTTVDLRRRAMKIDFRAVGMAIGGRKMSVYAAKRTILGIVLEKVVLNSSEEGFSLGFTVRKPFDVLVDQKLVPIAGASGTPIELFLATIRDISPQTLIILQQLPSLRDGALPGGEVVSIEPVTSCPRSGQLGNPCSRCFGFSFAWHRRW
jgi:hypothetical protein